MRSTSLGYFIILLTCVPHLCWRMGVDGVLQYSREFLLSLQNTTMGTIDPAAVLPEEMVRSKSSIGWSYKEHQPSGLRKRGRRGGVRQRLKREGLRRIPLPTITLANIQSLRGKIDELRANVQSLEEYKNSCLLALTETWLKERDADSELDIPGFGEPLRLDRNSTVTGKSLGGGVCQGNALSCL